MREKENILQDLSKDLSKMRPFYFFLLD